MATKKTGQEPGKKSNKFRLVVFEGDFSDDSVSEIAQALTSALRPSVAPSYRQISNGKPPAQILPPSEDDAEYEENAGEQPEESEVLEAEASTATPKAVKPSKPKKHKQPELVDLDWIGTGGPAFKDFAKEKAPKSKSRKYLVAALWLKEYGGHPTVNADKIYSAFRAANWSVAFADWGQTFHNLVHSDHMRKGTNTGEFSITTVGEGLLEKAEE